MLQNLNQTNCLPLGPREDFQGFLFFDDNVTVPVELQYSHELRRELRDLPEMSGEVQKVPNWPQPTQADLKHLPN